METEKNEITIRPYREEDLSDMAEIWNQVVEDGMAFPQEEKLDLAAARAFFATQTHTAVAEENGEILGLYILHPNNIGRCGHIANASYAVRRDCRGRHLGEKLVKDCMKEAAKAGFRLLQFNAVVASNLHARHLYERLGFIPLGTVRGGFRNKAGVFEDICLYYIALN